MDGCSIGIVYLRWFKRSVPPAMFDDGSHLEFVGVERVGRWYNFEESFPFVSVDGVFPLSSRQGGDKGWEESSKPPSADGEKFEVKSVRPASRVFSPR